MTDLPRLRHLFLVFLIALAWPACAAEQARRVAGFIEKVIVGNPGAEFEGKLDTGADISSIDATHVTQTVRNGRTWIDFTAIRVDGSGVNLSGPLVRHSRIRRAGGVKSRRPVVLLELCLGSVSQAVEVSLANRKDLNFDVLVGRNFLRGNFVVDPALRHALPPNCPGREAK